MFRLYSSGVFTALRDTCLDHSIMVVGYGTDAGTDCWKVVPVSQTFCPWEHVCARAEDDGHPDRAILGKSFSRHDLVRHVCVSRVVDSGCHPGVLHECEGSSVSQEHH